MNALTAICITDVLLACTLSAPTLAQQPDHRLGEHPAVIVKRMYGQQGYDYASKFYPHPAWLYLDAEAPPPMMDHPAVIVARRERERLDSLAKAATCRQDGVVPPS